MEPAPEFRLDDPEAEVLARHERTGAAAVGAKCGGLRVYAAHPAAATRDFLRNFLRNAGVHLYDDDPADVVFAAGALVGIHSAVSGAKHLRLPRPARRVTPLLDGGLGACRHAGARLDFELTAPATVLFRLE